MSRTLPELVRAPNIPLDWYVAGGQFTSGELPFSESPHVSVATNVQSDDETGLSAEAVGDYICDNLPNVAAWEAVLAPATATHVVDSAHIVEPAQTYVDPLEVTVADRVTGELVAERRQPWVRRERLL